MGSQIWTWLSDWTELNIANRLNCFLYCITYENMPICCGIQEYMCEISVVKSYLTLCNSVDFSPPGSSYDIFQGRMLERFVISSPREFSQPRRLTRVSCISCVGRLIVYHHCTWEAQNSRTKHIYNFKKYLDEQLLYSELCVVINPQKSFWNSVYNITCKYRGNYSKWNY